MPDTNKVIKVDFIITDFSDKVLKTTADDFKR